MRLIKRLIELAFVILIISLFMKNKDIELSINYFGLKEPIKLAFWELVTLCVSVGIIIAALGDFITQLKWVRERRRMVKTDRETSGRCGSFKRKDCRSGIACPENPKRIRPEERKDRRVRTRSPSDCVRRHFQLSI